MTRVPAEAGKNTKNAAEDKRKSVSFMDITDKITEALVVIGK